MRKLILVIVLAATLAAYSCGNQNGTKEAGNHTPATDSLVNSTGGGGANGAANGGTQSGASSNTGAQLVAVNDCKTCHAISQKQIGPSFNMIANKYENNDAMVDELATKIIRGGYGRWGTVPMTPHPQVSESDARLMAGYVLSLRTK